MRTGDLVFIRGTGLSAAIIKWVTKSNFSHTAVYIGNGQVIEAQAFRKVGFQDLSVYDGEYDIVPLPQIVTNEGLKNGLNWLMNQRGRRYDWWADFVILMRCLFRVYIPWKEGAEIMCSRLDRDFVFECGLPIPDEDWSPEDLIVWMKRYSQKLNEVG